MIFSPKRRSEILGFNNIPMKIELHGDILMVSVAAKAIKP